MVDQTRRRVVQGLAAAAGGLTLGLGPSSPAGSDPAVRLAADSGPQSVLDWYPVVFAQVKAERCTPPSAARIYAYYGLAAYEAVVNGMPANRSLGGQLNGLPQLPRRAGLHWPLVATATIDVTLQAAFADRSQASRAVLAAFGAEQMARLSGGLDPRLAQRSLTYGRELGAALAASMAGDNYLATRDLPYEPPVGPDKWERTPPNFGAPLEPHWGRIRSFTLTANDEAAPAAPVPYSQDPASAFWAQARTVYDTVNANDPNGRTTAFYWRDNPDGTTGLPAGHWMGIAVTVIGDLGLALGRAAEVLALTGIGLADGFTSCWTEKYRTNLLRPVTYIRRFIDPVWSSPVNSPAFPEYTSGHSVGSGAAAEVLTALLGDVSFVDTVSRPLGFADRTFASFRAAADEAARSRLHGGIHYPMGIEQGLVQGHQVGQLVLARAVTRHPPP